MKKSKILLSFAALLLLTLSACGQQGGSSGGDTPGGDTPGGGGDTPVDPVAEKFTVTFNTKGGSAVRKQEVEKGEKATKPANPTKSGYDFVDWYLDEAYTNVYDFNTPVTKDITLYAKWALSVSPVLLASLAPDAIDNGDTEFSVWTPNSGFIGHTAGGWQNGCTINMSWRTVVAVDAQGRVCFAVWCAANGYGVPKEYSYVCHEYYSKNGVGFKNNPAFKFGENYASNNLDWQLVVPEGGFIITGHTNGANMIDEIVSGGKFELYGGEEEVARTFNQSHCEFSTRSIKFVNNKVEVYDLATHLTYTGTKSGAFEGDAEKATYSKELLLYEGDNVKLNFFDGVVDFDITDTVTTITGDYTTENDHTGKMYVVVDEQNPDSKKKLIAGSRGKYTFSYVYTTNTLSIAYEETLSFNLYLNDIIADEYITEGVTYNEPFELPEPGNTDDYTFSRWVNSKGETVTSGTYEIKDDMTLYAAYKDKNGKEVAYTGKQAPTSTSANTEFSVLGSDTNFIAHSHDGWAEGCTWDMSWRTFAIIDAEGRVCYAVWCPANGYGGPTAYSYHCDPYYQASGVGYAGNPVFTIDPDLGEWPNLTPDGRKSWQLFTITVPEGGYIISTYDSGAKTLVSMLSGGELTEESAELNKSHSWDTRFDVDESGVVYSRLNLAE